MSNKQAAQLAQLKEIEESYSDGQTMNELAESYEGGEIIPIYTPEQFSLVGTGETGYVAETGKVYTYSTDKTYMFYGQAEDITNVINEIVAEKCQNMGKATLLWDTNMMGTAEGEIKGEVIEVESLSNYRYIYIESLFSYDGGTIWYTAAVEQFANQLVPMDIFRVTDAYYGSYCRVKYNSDTSISVETSWTEGDLCARSRIYGIE